MQTKGNFKILAVLPRSPGLHDVCFVTDSFFPGVQGEEGVAHSAHSIRRYFYAQFFWMEYQFSQIQTSVTLFTNFPLHSGSHLNFRPLVQSLFVCQIYERGHGLTISKGRSDTGGHLDTSGTEEGDNVTFSFSYNLCESFNLNVQSLCSTVTIPTYVLLNVFLNNLTTSCVSAVSILARGSQFLEIWWTEH